MSDVPVFTTAPGVSADETGLNLDWAQYAVYYIN